MKVSGIGNLALFLGGLVGATIGIIILLVDSQSFPKIPPGLYSGSITFLNQEEPLIVEIKNNDQFNQISYSTIRNGINSDNTQSLIPNTSRLSLRDSYFPVKISYQQSTLFLTGKSYSKNTYSGVILDTNRNTVGEWTLISVTGIENLGLSSNSATKAAANIIYVDRSTNDQLRKIKQDYDQIDKDLNRATILLANLSTLSAEGAEKLKVARIEREQANRALKESQSVLDRLHDQILITQRVSPQRRLYELSLESLRLEKKWFFIKLINEKNVQSK